MRLFLKRILLFFLLPLALLAGLYVVTDPYKTLRPFSLTYFDSTNRDYLSSELFILNSKEIDYDSFIFGSSRACGINSYHWVHYLPEGSRQFVFQAWGETITGIDQKVRYLDETGVSIKNALILLDVPRSLDKVQEPTEALSIKDPAISKQPKFVHESILFWDFIQKPSQWTRAVKRYRKKPYVGFDTVSNDWEKGNKDLDITVPPSPDSLNRLSKTAKKAFLKNLTANDGVTVNSPLITSTLVRRLESIRSVFDKHETSWRIIVTPGFCYKDPAISPDDLTILQQVFGAENVFDYSRKNEWNSDYNNYTDPNHFGLGVGWMMIEEIYNASPRIVEKLK